MAIRSELSDRLEALAQTFPRSAGGDRERLLAWSVEAKFLENQVEVLNIENEDLRTGLLEIGERSE